MRGEIEPVRLFCLSLRAIRSQANAFEVVKVPASDVTDPRSGSDPRNCNYGGGGGKTRPIIECDK